MLYKYENGVLIEYTVKIDSKKLKKIREEIIENCSIIEHCKGVFADFLPHSDNQIIIKNMKMGELHHIQENMGWPDTNYYEYTYDKYYFPNIIKIIDDILSGNEDQIESLFSEEDLKYDINNYRDISPLNDINNLLAEYVETHDESKLSSAQIKLSMFKHRNINKQKRSIKDYYLELQKCFEFQKVTSYNQDGINELQKLFGDEWQTKVKEILKQNDFMSSSIKNPYVKQLMS